MKPKTIDDQEAIVAMITKAAKEAYHYSVCFKYTGDDPDMKKEIIVVVVGRQGHVTMDLITRLQDEDIPKMSNWDAEPGDYEVQWLMRLGPAFKIKPMAEVEAALQE